MRLIVSVDALSPRLTGIGRYAWELVRRLRTRDDLKQLRFYRAGRWVADPERLLDAPQSLPDGNGAATSPAWRLRTPRWARDLYWHTTTRFNVFHAPNYFLPPCARNGVVTIHDLSVLRYPETHPAERVREWDRSLATTLERASQLITDAEATRQEVIERLRWPSDRVSVVPLGVSSDYRPRTPEQLQPMLAPLGLVAGAYTLCVATLEPRKRIDTLLGAYRLLPATLRQRHPLVLVGQRGWRSDALMQQVADARAAGWLQHLGFVDTELLPALYAGAAAFAYPSVYEGFGLPVVEAMASGVPVVTSNCSSLPEVAGGAAWLVDPDQAQQLAHALEEMLTQPDRCRAAVERGRAHAARYTWDACVDQTFEVYRRALR